MKHSWRMAVLLGLSALSMQGQGTVQLLNSPLSALKFEATPGAPLVDAPVGTEVALLRYEWDSARSNFIVHLAPPRVTINFPGIFNGSSMHLVDGVAPGQEMSFMVAAWYGNYYGQSARVQSSNLGPAEGPGTVIWISSSGSGGGRRAKPFALKSGRSSQSIEFSNRTEIIPGRPDLSLAVHAQTSSGLPIAYASSNPSVATVDGASVTNLHAGTTIMTAYQEGDAYFWPAIASQELAVVPPIGQGMLESVAIGTSRRLAPVGMPAILVNGTFVLATNFSARGPAMIELRTTRTDTVLLFTTDGSEPELGSTVYTGPFVLASSKTLRTRSIDLDTMASIDGNPVVIQVLPTLEAWSAGGGSVLVSPPSGAYLKNMTIYVRPLAFPGWTFLQMLGDARPSQYGMLEMHRNYCLEAVFGTSLATGTVGRGTIALSGGNTLHPFGQEVVLTALPEAGQCFSFWTGAITSTNNPLHFTVTNAHPELTAVFVPLPAGSETLLATVDGLGRVEMFPRRNQHIIGSVVRLTAIPEPDQTFVGWAGDASGFSNPLTVSLNSSLRIVAKFTRRPRLSVEGCGGEFRSDEVRLRLTGEPDHRYQIEGNANLGLGPWLPRGLATNLFGVTEWTDLIAPGDGHRLYRAVEVTVPPSL